MELLYLLCGSVMGYTAHLTSVQYSTMFSCFGTSFIALNITSQQA